jgi:hypothetical protein
MYFFACLHFVFHAGKYTDVYAMASPSRLKLNILFLLDLAFFHVVKLLDVYGITSLSV